MLTIISRSLFKILESIATPCSVNTYGGFLSPIFSLLDITICDFHFVNEKFPGFYFLHITPSFSSLLVADSSLQKIKDKRQKTKVGGMSDLRFGLEDGSRELGVGSKSIFGSFFGLRTSDLRQSFVQACFEKVIS